jgi:DNA-binding transcriptional ArsR family regulator
MSSDFSPTYGTGYDLPDGMEESTFIISHRWLEAAARLPGKALHVGFAIWYAAELTSSISVPFSNVTGLRFGVDRNAKYRALALLERAGLIRVERRLGRSPVVTIIVSEDRMTTAPGGPACSS